jgi:signal transduction histidine kinase
MNGSRSGYDRNTGTLVKRIGQNRIEWTLLAVIALVCTVLSFLQYRWTGELSRAEPALLRAGLNEQLRRFALAFNNEIRETCMALLPDAKEIGELGTIEAHRIRYQQWASLHNRSLLTRIAIAAPLQGKLDLYGIDGAGGIGRTEWPSTWEPFRSAMTARIAGSGRPPNARPDSDLIELPVFSAGTPGSELEWMILEINKEYIRTKVMPQLVAEYLNPNGAPVYDVSVSWSGAGGAVVYSTRADHSSVASGADAAAGMFSTDMGVASAHGHGRSHDQRWTIAVRHREGSLDAAVSRARFRNLFASLVLVALLGGTAWALVQYTARSRRLSDMQFRFAAGVSHDLRTPLTAIRGAAFNLIEGVVKEPAAVTRYLKLILRNAEELTAMIENVLAFSSSLHSNKNSRPEVIAVGDILQHAVSAMMQEIEQAGCHVEVNIAAGLPPVAGDPVAVELVFRNLIGNAVRHGVEGKWIGVSAVPFGAGVEVRVCDHGPGIPEPEQERIFEPFYRGEQTRAHRVPGTGLGLSLVKNTIERYKGTVDVVNASGGGAQFTVRLPALQQTAS